MLLNRLELFFHKQLNFNRILVCFRPLFGLTFILILVFLTSGNESFPQTKKFSEKPWYCDERPDLIPNLQAGKITAIYEYKKTEKNQPIAEFIKDGIEYRTVNVVKYQAVDLYTNKILSDKFEIYNVTKKDGITREFRVGETYIFESDFLGINPFGKGQYEYKLDYIKPTGFLKLYSEAKEEIELFKKFKGFDKFKEVLGIANKKAVTVGVLAGKAVNLAKPNSPKDINYVGHIEVLVLIDEKGNVIKAKAFCAKTEGLAFVTEKAASASKFMPEFRNGKPVKVKTSIFYKFVAPR